MMRVMALVWLVMLMTQSVVEVEDVTNKQLEAALETEEVIGVIWCKLIGC